MQKLNSNNVAVKKARTGLGLFATRTIEKGDFLIEYTGEIISNSEADKRGGKYLFEISSKRTIDGKGRENIGRYINHFCRPNAEAEIDRGRVFIYAKKKIKASEEIMLDYGKEYFDEFIKPHGCKCQFCQMKDQVKKIEK